jgi:hypothetical protein
MIHVHWVKEEVLSWTSDKIGNMNTQVGYLIGNVLNIYTSVAQVLAPFRSGNLRDSFVFTQVGLEGVIYNTAEYMIFVIFGTKAHEIHAVNALALWWPGALHPVYSVWHPGTSANDFLADVVPSGEPGVDDEISKTLEWLAT